jgi:hypothetical protein
MNRIGLVMGLAWGLVGAGQGAEPPGPEWQVLEALVGRWEGDYTIGTSPKARSRSENELVLDGRFVRSSIESTDAMGNVMKVMVMWGYDPGKKKYTRSFFFSSGGTFHETGTYEPITKTFSFSDVDLTTGQARTATVRVADADTLQWQITLPTRAGQPPLVSVGSNKRSKLPK